MWANGCEDAEEFLGFFLDTLEEELLALAPAVAPAPTLTPAGVEAEEPPGAQDGWLEVWRKNRAVVTRSILLDLSRRRNPNLAHLRGQVPLNAARSGAEDIGDHRGVAHAEARYPEFRVPRSPPDFGLSPEHLEDNNIPGNISVLSVHGSAHRAAVKGHDNISCSNGYSSAEEE
ncbi:hypothetical protein DFH09DRAFT_1104895 [Mycena vulgaris]|nr:hypothetical protein DFH09DRAFT_1104895 [Mycena vulgaris]